MDVKTPEEWQVEQGRCFRNVVTLLFHDALLILLLLYFPTALVMMDPELVREYEEAVLEAPELVRKECRVCLFLSTENGDTLASAHRIARYWKARKQLFGERWLRPMDMTGRGALSTDDIEILRSGYYALVPSRDGQFLRILMDRGRLPRQAGLSEVRLAFYWTAIHAGAPFKGYTRLHVVTSAPRPPVELSTTGPQILASALPLSLARTNFLVAQAYEESKKELIDFIGYQTQKSFSFRIGVNIPLVAANSLGDTLKQLQAMGVEQNCLPPCLGGTYDYRSFDNFIRTRLTIEGTMSAAPLHVNYITSAFDEDEDEVAFEFHRDTKKVRQEVPWLEGPPSTATPLSPPFICQQLALPTGRIIAPMLEHVPQTGMKQGAISRANVASGKACESTDPTESIAPDLKYCSPQTSMYQSTVRSKGATPSSTVAVSVLEDTPQESKLDTAVVCAPAAALKTPTALPDDSQKAAKKPAVRTYRKRIQQSESLEKERHALDKRNSDLRRNNRFLESCLAKARWMAAVVEESTTAMATTTTTITTTVATTVTETVNTTTTHGTK